MTDTERKEIVKYRLSRAHETLNEVDILIENKLWNTAVNRLYYACYYAVNALLINKKIQAQTHAGVRQMFGLHFVKTGRIDKEFGKFYSIIFDKRLTGDYDDFVDHKEEDVLFLKSKAEKFIQETDKLIVKPAG
jgi:uncharacterized protein (UPF0332 family)